MHRTITGAKSLSDLNGIDPYIRGGTGDGLFREKDNALVRKDRRPNVLQMWAIYREVRGKPPPSCAAAARKPSFKRELVKGSASLPT